MTIVEEERELSSEAPGVARPSAARAWTWWLLRRVGLAALTLWLVSLVVFFATSSLGDPVRAILGKDYAVSPERVAAIEAAMKIDWYWMSMKPIFEPHFGSSQSLKPFGAGEMILGL